MSDILKGSARSQPVHCDARIVHAPKECEMCDKHGRYAQDFRIAWMINFTGHHDPEKLPCPSEVFRGLIDAEGNGNQHQWPGNTPDAVPLRATEDDPKWIDLVLQWSQYYHVRDQIRDLKKKKEEIEQQIERLTRRT
jgi:hypothetical protein